MARNVSVTDGEALLIFDFYIFEKGQCCVFWEENLMHTQLSLDGLINLKHSYCGRVSDSGITAQTQYLTFQGGHVPCTYWLIPCLDLFALGTEITDRLIQIWNCRKKSSFWAAIEMPRLGEGESLNYNSKYIVAMFADITFCWPSAQELELLAFWGLRVHLTRGNTVPLVWASWAFLCLSWL